jgi:hypothetical protein
MKRVGYFVAIPLAALAGPCLDAHADTPDDTCVTFTRSEQTQAVGDRRAALTDPGSAIRLCGRDSNLTRAFIRERPSKLPKVSVCEVIERPMPLLGSDGLGKSEGSGNETANHLGGERRYLAWSSSACPPSEADAYVLTGISPEEFEEVWGWWAKVRDSRREQADIRDRLNRSATKGADTASFWSALDRKAILLRSCSVANPAGSKHGKNGDFTVILGAGQDINTLYKITLRNHGGQLIAEEFSIVRP